MCSIIYYSLKRMFAPLPQLRHAARPSAARCTATAFGVSTVMLAQRPTQFRPVTHAVSLGAQVVFGGGNVHP